VAEAGARNDHDPRGLLPDSGRMGNDIGREFIAAVHEDLRSVAWDDRLWFRNLKFAHPETIASFLVLIGDHSNTGQVRLFNIVGLMSFLGMSRRSRRT